MQRDALILNGSLAALTGLLFFLARTMPKPPAGTGIAIGVLSFLAGGLIIFFAGEITSRYIPTVDPEKPDLFLLLTGVWKMLLVFPMCWFAINECFLFGLNVSGLRIDLGVGLWVMCSVLAPPIIMLARKGGAYIAEMDGWQAASLLAALASVTLMVIGSYVKTRAAGPQ
jgi:hypothetical protein